METTPKFRCWNYNDLVGFAKKESLPLGAIVDYV
jgi:hypothetical protein